jgi:uncharacterized lipoprotein NlpE involved in copper resistance
MEPKRKVGGVVAVVAIAAATGIGYWLWKAAEQRKADAKALCEKWDADLEGKTTPVGAYVRHDGETLPAADPWGNELRVAYSSGGLAEKVEVRSCGPDGKPFTADDIVAWRMSANSANIAEGALEAAGKLGKAAAKAAGKAAVEGAKDKLGIGSKPDRRKRRGSSPAGISDIDV